MENLKLLEPILAVAAGTLSGLPDGHPMLERFDDLLAGKMPSDTLTIRYQDPPEVITLEAPGFDERRRKVLAVRPAGFHGGAAQVLASPATDLRIPKRKKNVNRPK